MDKYLDFFVSLHFKQNVIFIKKNNNIMKRLFYLFTSLILLATTFFFQSCSDEKYTVWTGSETYSEFYNLTQVTINDGYYIRWEITESQWNEFSKKLSKKERNRWDEETIKKWFIANGFGQAEATKESSWLTLINHGFVVSRDDNLVYLILK